MKKGYISSLVKVASIGAIFGFAKYMIEKNKFSKETKTCYSEALDSVKNVGSDIKRTYTAIGDEKAFKAKSDNLKESAKTLAKNTGKLILSASSDVYNYASDNVKKAIENASKDESLQSLASKFSGKGTTKKVVSKTSNKSTSKTTKKVSNKAKKK